MYYFYPSDQQALFTNRRQELAALDHYHHSLLNGPVEHVALFGLRRIGKTHLLKEFMRQLSASTPEQKSVFLDFSVICSSPENFTLGFIGSICYWLLEEGKSDPEPFLNPATLGTAVLKAGGDNSMKRSNPSCRNCSGLARIARHCCVRLFDFPGKPQLL